MHEQSFSGGCYCGAVRYEATGPATHQCVCHCASCRRAAGAPCVAWVTFATQAFDVTRGKLCEYRSSPEVVRGHCQQCGTTLTYRNLNRSGEVDVSLTTLDEDCALEPQRHIWTEDRLSWLIPGDALPQYQQYCTTDIADKSDQKENQ